MSEILKSIEEACAPSYALDVRIAQALVPGIVVSRQRLDDSGADPHTHRSFTAKVDDALWLLETLLPGTFYFFAKGRTRPDEPLFGFQILTSQKIMGENEVIAEAEHEYPAMAILSATVRALSDASEGGQ